MSRRAVLLSTAVLTVATTVGSGVAAASGGADGRFDRPQHGFAQPWTTLRDGSPERAGLDRAPIDAAVAKIDEWTRTHPDPAQRHPLFAGAVSLLAHDGVVVKKATAGYAVRYSDEAGTELPAESRVPMRENTIFDMASISKLFTAVAVMQLTEEGKVDLAAPVSRYLPEFGVNGKADITVKQLLTHVSGLEPFIPLWRDWPDKAARIKAVMDVKPKTTPGTAYAYSDLNLITLGVLVERLTGSSLDQVVGSRVTGPLRMNDTGYNPPASKLDRIASTEFQATPPRGIVRGQVHDENAWSLGGVAGHAGVFSTAPDMAIFGQMVLNGGTYGGRRVLRPETVKSMLVNYNQAFPANARGLGFELNQLWYMGGLTTPGTAGHTGFTGTTLVIDPTSRSVAILLTNRVHPSRNWGSINIARETLATGLAKSLAVRPKHGKDSWYTGIGDASTATLTTKQLRPRGTATVSFDAFVDTESTDRLVLESSVDGVQWQPVTVSARGSGAPAEPTASLSGGGHRAWWSVRAEVPASDTIALRWRYSTDARYTGRGVHLDNIKITERSRVLLDGEKQPGALDSQAWNRRIR